MGNTLIKDATTGALMELSPGFVPIGMKEYGGILYIASADKDGNGEIGSIPSPVITWSQDDVTFIQIDDMPIVTKDGISDTLVRISDRLKPGNRFAVLLNLESDGVLEYPIKLPGFETTLPLISTIDRKGLYRMELYSIGDTSTHRLTTVENTRQDWYAYDQDTPIVGEHWYIPYTGKNFNLNMQEMLNHEGLLQHYPKTGAGYLAIKAAIEDIEWFKMIPRDEAGNQYVPINTFDTETGYYISQFIGFQVQSKSGRRVGHIQITVLNESTHQYQPIFFWKPQYKPDAWGEYDESTFHPDGNQTMDLYLVEKSGITGNVLTTTAKWDDEGEYIIDYYYAANYKKPGVGCEYVGTDKLMNIYCNYPKYNNILYYSEKNKNTAIPCLCYIKNTKQNVWYTVQAKYYDQFDQYIGTYTSIFNPYVNDVLGSMYGLETRDGEWIKQVISSTTDVTLLEKNITIDFIDGNLKTGSLVPNTPYWTAGYIKGHYAGCPVTPKFKAATIITDDGNPDLNYEKEDLQCTLEKNDTYTGTLKSTSQASYLGKVVNYNKKTTNIPSPITSWELACALPYYHQRLSTMPPCYEGAVSITTDRELLKKYVRVDGYQGYMREGKELYTSPKLRYERVDDLKDKTLEDLQYLGNDYFTYYYHSQWEDPVKQSIKGGVVMDGSEKTNGSVFVYGQPKEIFADIPVSAIEYPSLNYHADTNVTIEGNSIKLDVGEFDYNMHVKRNWDTNAPKSFLVYALGTEQTAWNVEPKEYYSPKIHITVPETVITDVGVTYNQYKILRQIEYDATTYDETGMKVTTLGGMNFKLLGENIHDLDELRENAGTYIQPTNLVLGVEDNLPHSLIPSDGEGLHIVEDPYKYIYGTEQPNSTLKNTLKYKRLVNTDSVLDFSASGTGFYVLLAYYSSNTPLKVRIGSSSKKTISNGIPYIWKSEDSTENLLKIESSPEYYANIGLFAVKKSVQSQDDVVLPFVENYWENVMQGTCHYYMGKEEATPTTSNIDKYAFPEQPYQLNRYILSTVSEDPIPAVYTWDTNNTTVRYRKAAQIAGCVTLQAGKTIQEQVDFASGTYNGRFDDIVTEKLATGILNKF